MRIWGLAALMASAATGAFAQDTTPAPAAAPAQTQGVVSYPASFFTDARANTAMEMLERLPGFAFDGGDSVRGFGGAAGNVLIDGERPAAKTDSLENILRRIPADQVERIDVIRGSAPGIDMQGKTVIANVIRKKSSGVKGLVAYANTFTEDGRFLPAARLEGSRRKDDTLLEWGLFAGKGFDDGSGDGPHIVRDGNGAILAKSYMDTEGWGAQFQGTLAYEQPLFGGKARANLLLFDDRFTSDAIDRPLLNAQREVQSDVQHRRQGELGLRYSRALGARSSMELTGLQTLKTNDYLSRFDTPADSVRFLLNDKTGETIGRGVFRYKPRDTLDFETGAEAAFNWLESQTTLDVNGGPVTLPAANVRVEEKRGEVFGTTNWRPSARWAFEAGLRVEGSTISAEGDVTLEKTLVFFKPRVAATWSPDDKTQLRFRVEREVGQLNFRDFVASSSLNSTGVQSGNPDLDPQQAWVAEVTAERRFWGKGAATLTYRHSEITDATDRAPVCSDPLYGPLDPLCPSVFDAPDNIGNGRQDLLQASLTLPLDRLWIKGGLLRAEGTWRFSEVTDPTTGDTRRISGQHPFDGEIHFSQDLPRWNGKWGVDSYLTFTERYYRYNSIDTVDLGTYIVVYAEYKPRPDLSLRTEFHNVGDRPLTITNEVYGGPRGTAPVLFHDRRDLGAGQYYYFRIRKTFG
jgi:hypothetical protein